MKEGTFDFYMATAIYRKVVFKVENSHEATVPDHVTKYDRNQVDVQLEWL